MHVLKPNWQGVPNTIGAFSTLRSGGVSCAPYDDGTGGGGLNLGMHVGDDPAAVMQNRARVQALLPAEPAWLNQVHGADVLNAGQVKNIPAADASIATEPGHVCVIQTADCLPVLFSDVKGKVVGAAHAGWRGLAGGVLEKTIASMRNAGADDIIAWMGPAIGAREFEVGEEVRSAFVAISPKAAKAFMPNAAAHGKYFADIYQLARLFLAQQGVDHVYGGEFCTVTQTEKFFSYRRDKVTGRMASFIWIAAD